MLPPVSMVIMIKVIFCVPLTLQEKQCKPVNCPPGKEIVSCIKTGTLEDQCQQCKAGYKQPDYISSHMKYTTCFLPINNSCLASDITYSRENKQTFCDSLFGCKCNVLKCFYGDPCICSKKNGCPPNRYLAENGVCLPCPSDTQKNGTGCGPCLFVLNQDPILHKMSLKYDTTVTLTTPQNGNTENLRNVDTTFNTPHVTTKKADSQSCESGNSAIPLASIGGVAVGLLALVVVLVVLLYRTRNGLPPCGEYFIGGVAGGLLALVVVLVVLLYRTRHGLPPCGNSGRRDAEINTQHRHEHIPLNNGTSG